MALNKKLLTAGTQIRVKSIKAQTAGIGFPLSYKDLPAGGLTFRDTGHVVFIGDVLTVIKPPRSVHGVNFCRVSKGSVEGEVFWTELRSNCEMM